MVSMHCGVCVSVCICAIDMYEWCVCVYVFNKYVYGMLYMCGFCVKVLYVFVCGVYAYLECVCEYMVCAICICMV